MSEAGGGGGTPPPPPHFWQISENVVGAPHSEAKQNLAFQILGPSAIPDQYYENGRARIKKIVKTYG